MPLPDRLRSRAILIGASSYEDARLPALPSVSHNLGDLKAALVDPHTGVFDAEHCTVIENPADGNQLGMALNNIAATAEDVLLFYYSGHGVIGTRKHELYLGISTTDLDRPRYSALPFTWVRDELLDSRASTKVLILDCCFSGRAINDFMTDRESLVLGQVDVKGTYTLTSTSANAAALAPDGVRYTAFTGELLSLLRDGIPAGPEELDLQSVYRELRHRMEMRGWPTPKQLGTDNVHGLALGRNLGHLPDLPAESRVLADLQRLLLTNQVSKEGLDRLLRDRVIVLDTEIDDEVANRVAAQMLKLAAEDSEADISLYINSTGGSVVAGMAIYDTMAVIEPDVSTWAIGLASGTAQLLLSAGAPGKRYALPHARVLLKSVFSPYNPNADMAINNAVIDKWNKEMPKLIAKATNQPVEQVRADSNQTRWFSAQEARDYGLVDHVVAGLHVT